MGNHKFRLSDMIPNAWFHKLKDMSKPRKQSKKKKQPKCTEPSNPKQLPHHHSHHHNHHHTDHNNHQCQPRQSYYFTRELAASAPSNRCCNSSPTNPKASDTNFPDTPPKKPSRQKPNTRITKTPSEPHLLTSSVCGCRASIESVSIQPDSPPELWSSSSFDTSPEPEFRCDRVLATETFDGMVASFHVDESEKDIVIDVDKASLSRKFSDVKLSDVADDGLDSFSDLELPPIIAKPAKFSELVRDVKKKKKEKTETKEATNKQRPNSSSVRRASTNATSPGLRLRINSPRIANRKINQANPSRRSVSSNSSSKRRSLSESFAIVKSSFDPQRDFRESMVEMIMENNIKQSKDLEDLLACYLSLNSDEYHELIIKVFKQIWFDLTDTRSQVN